MNSKDFKTKTFIQPRLNPTVPGKWPIALDIGYSSVKMFSPNMVASFPSYAKRVEFGSADNAIGELDKTSISYRDENGHEYYVGENAQKSIRYTDSDNSTASLYIRDRYYSPEFKVIARVGMALGLGKNHYGSPEGRSIFLQTGLPPEYMSTDTDDIKNALAGRHVFKLKIGSGEWKSFDFTIETSNIGVMPQPMGTLVSIGTNNNGEPLAVWKDYTSSSMLIVDPGFGTLDTFEIYDHRIVTSKTWNNLGMLRVLQETSKIIQNEYGQVIPVPAMQKVLEDGVFKTRFDRATRRSETVDINPILERAVKSVCEEAVDTIDGFYNLLQGKDYLVITGGTGEAWFDILTEKYGESGVKIIRGNVNDDIPMIFSNVRGYYMTAVTSLRGKTA